MQYDVAIIGGGISGLMIAYKLLEKKEDINIIIIERGKELEKRECPIEKRNSECINCKECSIMNGMAGAGAFSDGKFIISTEYGGKLQEIIGDLKAEQYMNMANEILEDCGATKETFEVNDELESLCDKNGLGIRKGKVKHFGTESNLKIMGNLIKKLRLKNCKILANSIVSDVDPRIKEIIVNENKKIYAKKIVFAVGRSGSEFLFNWCKKNKIKTFNNNVDLGVRVELKSTIWDKITSIAYDPKIYYKSELYKDETRMFCFNVGGKVVLENTFEIKTVNGHAYKDEKTENSNFALLSSIKLTEPFDEPLEYIKLFAKCVNKISNDTVIVQRYGDLKKGRRTTKERLDKSSVIPTLKVAYPGDISLCLPKRQLDNIMETIEKLDNIAPGTAGEDTLLYGIEGKYYSFIPKMEDFVIDGYDDIYACGDGCGATRSLAQAAANGLYLAEKIIEKLRR